MTGEQSPTVFRHRLLGMGLKIEETFRFDEDVSIHPTKINSDIRALESRSLTQMDYGFLCALAESITFELEITKKTQKAAAIAAWNSQWILVLLSIIGGHQIYAPFESYDRGELYG